MSVPVSTELLRSALHSWSMKLSVMSLTRVKNHGMSRLERYSALLDVQGRFLSNLLEFFESHKSRPRIIVPI